MVKHLTYLRHKINLLFPPFNFVYVFRITLFKILPSVVAAVVPLQQSTWKLQVSGLLHKKTNSCRSLSYMFLIFGIAELTGPLIARDQSRVDVKYSFISKWSFQQRWKTYAYYLESRLKTSKEELPLQSEHSYALAFEHVTSSFLKYKNKWLP